MVFFPANILLFGISGGEILIALLAVLLLFGPKKIPEIARMIGRGINEVKKVQREINSEIHRYSADIENEARDVQQKIDKLTKDMSAPLDQPETGPASDASANADSETDLSADTEDGEDELPYPYNKKTGEVE